MSARACFGCGEPVVEDADDLVTYADGTVEHGPCLTTHRQFMAEELAAGNNVIEHANGAVEILAGHTMIDLKALHQQGIAAADTLEELDLPFQVTAGDDDEVHIALTHRGITENLITVLAAHRDTAMGRAWSTALDAAAVLTVARHPDVRAHWELVLAANLAALAESSVLRDALTAVLTPPQAADLSEAVDNTLLQIAHDQAATERGEQLYAAGLNDEPDREP